MIKRVEMVVPGDAGRIRLEDFLFKSFPRLSRMYLRDLVKQGSVEVNGRQENRGYKLKSSDFVEIEVEKDRENSMSPEELPIDIVFEDGDLLVIDKPAGMLVHPTHREKTGTLLNGLAFYLNGASTAKNSSVIRPGLVHRLDKGTSGLMVVAKKAGVHAKLARQFQRKQVEKSYIALVSGVVGKDSGTIESRIGRFADAKFWGVKEDGKLSVSEFRVRERWPETTLLDLVPVTGRTNQLRIHCEAMGHPIVGDLQRGGSAHPRLCLHAAHLGFKHPANDEWLTFESSAEFSSRANE